MDIRTELEELYRLNKSWHRWLFAWFIVLLFWSAILLFHSYNFRSTLKDEGIERFCDKYYCEEPDYFVKKIIKDNEKILDLTDKILDRLKQRQVKLDINTEEKLCSVLEEACCNPTYEEAIEFCEMLPDLDEDFFNLSATNNNNNNWSGDYATTSLDNNLLKT